MPDLRTRWLERAAGHEAQVRHLDEELAEAKLPADRVGIRIRWERQYLQWSFWTDRVANLECCPDQLAKKAVGESARLRTEADLWTRAAEELKGAEGA